MTLRVSQCARCKRTIIKDGNETLCLRCESEDKHPPDPKRISMAEAIANIEHCFGRVTFIA